MQHGRSASRLRGGSKRSISSLQAFPNRRLAKIASLDGPCTILQQSQILLSLIVVFIRVTDIEEFILLLM